MVDGMIKEADILLAKEGMQTALEAGASAARFTINRSCMDLVGTLNGEIDKVNHSLDSSMSIQLFVDGRYAAFSTNRLESAALKAFILKSVEMVRIMAKDEFRKLADPARTEKGAVSGKELGLYDDTYDSMTPEKRVELALGAVVFDKCSSAKCKIISEEGEYNDCVFDTIVMDTEGLFCRHTETSFEYGVEITVQDETEAKYSGTWWDATPRLKDLSISRCGAKAFEIAEAQTGPRPRRSGKYRMVVDSECSSRLLTPVLNALSGHSVQQKNSFLLDSVGKKVFGDGMTVMDMCRTHGETGSRLFDTEGVATTEHAIISSGTVNEYFINTYIAGKMGVKPNIEDAIRPKVMPWPKPGMDREALMKLCRNGILVTGFNGGNTNSTTGDYSFGIEGFAFKDGKITHPVREMLITGNLVTLWNSIIGVGDDARLCKSKLTPSLAFEGVDFSG
ncbi:MAG: TldD/PmbA family protein [Bacteroidales bacterium]|nr:TldD/PmbA family protein [Bacteroidales bacterium]